MINVHCVVVREVGAPAGIKPIEWRLLTNRAVATQEQAIELINWYRARWEIEIYFHVLKNGCEVETLQLAAVDRIERALALFMVVAWRVTYLMRKGRTCPELDASLFQLLDVLAQGGAPGRGQALYAQAVRRHPTHGHVRIPWYIAAMTARRRMPYPQQERRHWTAYCN